MKRPTSILWRKEKDNYSNGSTNSINFTVWSDSIIEESQRSCVGSVNVRSHDFSLLMLTLLILFNSFYSCLINFFEILQQVKWVGHVDVTNSILESRTITTPNLIRGKFFEEAIILVDSNTLSQALVRQNEEAETNKIEPCSAKPGHRSARLNC